MHRVSVSTASQLLDFTAGGRGPLTREDAQEQLEGAVAIHNLLAGQGVAYLADEVGMGKTYVALGAIALLRHFEPNARVMVIAPRENIQKKWIKELGNFVAGNVRVRDLRVKAVHDAPARSPVLCRNLETLIHETILDPDRDFFARMTSFSVALGKDTEGWKRTRDDISRHLPWIDPKLFYLHDREQFKDSVGRALNAALPEFDLVVVDEGHNLKHGLGAGTSTRNRLISLAFGHPDSDHEKRDWPTYGPRARRVLFLSATPLEDDFRHLWNQLNVFGKAGPYAALRDRDDPEAQRECARQFLVRRVFTLNCNGKALTKNLYRREWREGGVVSHDDPIEVPDARQQLIVALVQKKVSELLANARFRNSFQIGMLASFESFLETARVSKDDEEGIFDGSDQAVDLVEREGIDVHDVNKLAANYRKTFKHEMPHPKMDALVDRLAHAFQSGEKTLVFVRRVASVSELKRKLTERYDAWLIDYVRNALKPELHAAFDRATDAYRQHTVDQKVSRSTAREARQPGDERAIDPGGNDSFFAWFFRGPTRVPGLLSGGQFALRFNSAGAVLGTFFEDNHVAFVLDAEPGNVTAALCQAVNLTRSDLNETLRVMAARRLSSTKHERGTVYLAYQAAALQLLAERGGSNAHAARILLEERYADMPERERNARAPALESRLETRTFWTELRRRPELCNALWRDHDGDRREDIRRRELRRELLSSMARLGHPLVDLYVSAVNVIGSLKMGTQSEVVDERRLIDAYLDCLESQQHSGAWTGLAEFKAAADQFDLILAANEPEARKVPLYDASRLFGRLLRAQEPIGGMSGQVNETLVRQFRMPGYPQVLITTELLKEGEDLHTFCANVMHYGLAWMPSSIEQRVGRIDRVGSLTERRLRGGDAEPQRLLQVFYPHLRQTVERLQVERVIRRQYDFLTLLHEGFGNLHVDPKIDVAKEATRAMGMPEQISEPLRTAYPVREQMLTADARPLAVPADLADRLERRFASLVDDLTRRLDVTWEAAPPRGALLGTRPMAKRVQPFTLLLRSTHGLPLIRCVSPVGVQPDLEECAEHLLRAVAGKGVRMCAAFDPRFDSYNLTLEADVLLDDDGRHDTERVAALVESVTTVADRTERALLRLDQPMTVFRDALDNEVYVDR